MKILIPTAKEMKVQSLEVKKQSLGVETKEIINSLKKLTKKDLEKFYKIKSEKAESEYCNIANLDTEKEKIYEALFLFDGLMYRNIKRFNLSTKEQNYYKNNVFITSSLYGIINVYSGISEHRLDFQQKISTKLGSLKEIWRPVYDNFIKDDETIISLLSSEFEEVFSKEVRDNFIKVLFFEKVDGKLKNHSTISKKARGQFLSCLVENNITELSKIKKMKCQDFYYDENNSEERKLVFIKEK